jgi:hypothetical protein
MNTIDYYDRQKEKWDDSEIEQIKYKYETDEMTISQIADIYHRTPGSISYKLKTIGVIDNNSNARGYIEYKNSDLYKSIVEKGKKDDSQKKSNKNNVLNSKIISYDEKVLHEAIRRLELERFEYDVTRKMAEIRSGKKI